MSLTSFFLERRKPSTILLYTSTKEGLDNLFEVVGLASASLALETVTLLRYFVVAQ